LFESLGPATAHSMQLQTKSLLAALFAGCCCAAQRCVAVICLKQPVIHLHPLVQYLYTFLDCAVCPPCSTAFLNRLAACWDANPLQLWPAGEVLVLWAFCWASVGVSVSLSTLGCVFHTCQMYATQQALRVTPFRTLPPSSSSPVRGLPELFIRPSSWQDDTQCLQAVCSSISPTVLLLECRLC
jgi:hypothetical protein